MVTDKRPFGSGRLKRKYTLKKNREFRYVFRKGRSVATKNMVIVYVVKKTPGLKIGFSVNKKIGKSVVRNRVKRRLRAVLCALMDRIKPNTLLVLVARPPIVDTAFAEIKNDMYILLKKADILKPENGETNA